MVAVLHDCQFSSVSGSNKHICNSGCLYIAIVTFSFFINYVAYADIIMFLTNVLFKKAKSKHIMVLMESMVSGHKFITIRERLADKVELLKFDPYIRCVSLYKERKKIRSMSSSFRAT